VVVVAPEEVATSRVRKLRRAINNRKVLPIIAFPLVRVGYGANRRATSLVTPRIRRPCADHWISPSTPPLFR
jgi:hypothetical protein